MLSHFNHNSLIALYGLIVSLISFLFFYLIGLASLPQKLSVDITSPRELSQKINGCEYKTAALPFFPAFVGAALFSVTCWFGIQWHFSLYTIFHYIFYLSAILCVIRLKYLVKILSQRLFIYPALFWISAYILLYALVYIFIPLPNIKKYLPLTWSYNVDIFNYINVTQHFISPAADAHYLIPYYYQTPAVFYFYAWMSLFFHHNAMSAAMPVLYSTVAAIGLMIIFYCYRIFNCPRKIALSIAAVILCGSFYRYVISAYFLSSLMGTIVWLAFLAEILQWQYTSSPIKYGWYYAFILIIYQGLLLLLYPVLFTFNFIIFGIVIGLMLLLSIKPFFWRCLMKRMLFFFGCFVTALLFLLLLFPGYIQDSFYNLFEFAHRTGVLGLSLLSPAAILGFPSYFEEILPTYIPLTFAFILCLSGLLYALHLSKLKFKPEAYVLLYLVIGAFAVYFFYYYLEGASRYQPWKFASYFILPLSGVFWALAFRLSPSEKPFLAIIIFFIVANFLWMPIKHQPHLPKNYEKLALLNAVPEKALYIKMSTPEATFLSVFFIRDKHLHLLSSSFYYYPRMSIKEVPQKSPIFIETTSIDSAVKIFITEH